MTLLPMVPSLRDDFAEAQNLLLHLATESCHTGDLSTGHDPGEAPTTESTAKGVEKLSGVLGFDICSFVCSLKWFPETQKINQKQWIDLVGTFAAWRKAFAPIFLGGSYTP